MTCGTAAKRSAPRDIGAEQAYEIWRLRMENELLRDFLRSTGSESKGKVCDDLPVQGKISCACYVPILFSVQKRLLQLCKADEPSRKGCRPCRNDPATASKMLSYLRLPKNVTMAEEK